MAHFFYAIFTDENLYTVRVPCTHAVSHKGLLRLGDTETGDHVMLKEEKGKITFPDGREFSYYTTGNPHPKLHDEESTILGLKKKAL